MKRVKDVLKGHEGLKRLVLRMGRFRFLLKARRVREEGARLRDDPVNVIRFVLLDPETHSYSYDLGNTDELARYVAETTGQPVEVIAGYLDEIGRDPELNERLTRRVRWRIETKRRMPLGNRLLWYALARAVKPRLVVETGVFDGLGSLMLLRALERNAEDGVEGELVSLDFDPHAGWLVPDDQRARWRMVVGDIYEHLGPAVEGREVDILIHDSDHNEPLQKFEFGQALAHQADPLYIIDSSGRDLPVLGDLCAARDARHEVFQEVPARHFYQPAGTAVAVFEARPGRFQRSGDRDLAARD